MKRIKQNLTPSVQASTVGQSQMSQCCLSGGIHDLNMVNVCLQII